MKDQNFSTAFTVDETPEEAFAAINRVRAWWTGEPGIEGSTRKLGDEFTYHYNPHEIVPGLVESSDSRRTARYATWTC
jgi:hypothetical protein